MSLLWGSRMLSIEFGYGPAGLAALLWPGVPPFAVVAVLLVAIAAGGPGLLIGCDFARTSNPSVRHGAASGFVNLEGSR